MMPENIKPDKTKKPSRRRFIFTIVILLLCIAAGYVYAVLKYESKPDPASERAIRQIVASQLKKDPNVLTDEDFAEIKALHIEGFIKTKLDIMMTDAEISDIRLLEKCKNLEVLSLYAKLPDSAIPKWMKLLGKFGVIDLKSKYSIDLSPLRKLPHLQELKINDIHASLKGLTNLRTLTISNKSVSNLKPIKGLVNLETLRFDNTQVSDLRPLKGLTKLKYLDLKYTQVSDLKPINGLTKLETLWLYGTQVSDIEPMRGLKNLVQLDIRFTGVSNLEPIKELTNLELLYISHIKVSNLEPLKRLTKLKRIGVGETQVSDIEPLRELTNLEILDIRNTRVSNLEPIKGLINLEWLTLDKTLVSDLEPLMELKKLRMLDLNETVISNLQLLKNLKNLKQLHLRNCENITDEQVEDLQKTLPDLNISR